MRVRRSHGVSKGLKRVALTLMSVALAPFAAQASTAIALGTGGSDTSHGTNYTLGFIFSPDADITVTSLGDFFPAASTTMQSVGLWSLFGTLLATATVTGPGASSDGFDFTAITPVMLTPGNDYVVGATAQSDDYVLYNSGGFVIGPQIDYLFHVESRGSGLVLPQMEYTSFNDFGGNFQYSATPEPAAWTMMLIGVGALGALFRARRRAVHGAADCCLESSV
jgi:MYXO-CTERM domain-containing protein